jgi:hypothetical protein
MEREILKCRKKRSSTPNYCIVHLNVSEEKNAAKRNRKRKHIFLVSGFQDRVIPLSQTQIPGIVITGEDVQYIFDYCEELRNSNVISHDVETIDGSLCLALFEHSKATMIELKEDVPRLNRLMLVSRNFFCCVSMIFNTHYFF